MASSLTPASDANSSPHTINATNTPQTPNGKSSAAPPKVTGAENVELKDIQTAAKPAIPPAEDIMQLARIGDQDGIQALFQSGRFEPTYKDDQGITPLHVRLVSTMLMPMRCADC